MKDRTGYVWRVFALTLRQLLRRPRFFVILLFPVLMVMLYRSIPTRELAAPVGVGVALRDETGKEFLELLESRSGEAVTFYPTDIETLEKNVSIARWDCGLIVEEDLDTRLRQLDTDELITLVISEGSAAYPLVRETVAACVAKLVTPHIAQHYLAEESMDGLGQLPVAQRVDIRLEVLDGGMLKVEQLADTVWSKLLLGVLTTAAAVYVLMICADLGRWLDDSVGRMECRLQGVALCAGPRLLAMLCPAVLGVALAALALGTAHMLPELLGLLVFLGALGLVFCRCPGLWRHLPAILPLSCPAALLYALTQDRLHCGWLYLLSGVLMVLVVFMEHRDARGHRE